MATTVETPPGKNEHKINKENMKNGEGPGGGITYSELSVKYTFLSTTKNKNQNHQKSTS